MAPPSSITQKRAWAQELRMRGYAILAPAQVKAALHALEHTEGALPDVKAAFQTTETLRDAARKADRHGA